MVTSIRLVRRMHRRHHCSRHTAVDRAEEDESVSSVGKKFIAVQKMMIAVKHVDYIWMLSHWIELPLFMLSLVFSVIVVTTDRSFCLSGWQWQIGAVILWLSWIEFMFLSIQFELFGVYTLMFIRILKSLLWLLPFGLPLVAAFGLTFHFLLYKPDLKVSSTMNIMPIH